MCGIFCCITPLKNEVSIKEFESVLTLLSHRGPDVTNVERSKLSGSHSGLFVGSVLWTQGPEKVTQPVTDSHGRILLWNGDIYDGLDNSNGDSDTSLMFDSLSHDVINTFSNVCGPYSFIYWDTERLWFGRDPLGRHSLLWSWTDDMFAVSSVVNQGLHFSELPANGIYIAEFGSQPRVMMRPWSHLTDVKMTDGVKIGQPITHKILSSINSLSLDKEPNLHEVQYFQVFNTSKENKDIMESLSRDQMWSGLVVKLKSLLEESVSVRVSRLPPFCRICLPTCSPCTHTKLAVLFSGGLDSAVIALLADEFIPKDEPIDLYNVAFERICGAGFEVPDRQTGRTALEEFCKLRPHRTWNFVEVDVTQDELSKQRQLRIKDLIYPLDTILDESLGCALWFAAKGVGTLDGKTYHSTARVVLVGMGADEMLGGYRKARKAWKEEGWSGLSEELRRGLRDIPSRNLARDNRVLSDHSLSARAPYLHEHLVAFISDLPPWQRCYFSKEVKEGVGDKLLLRLLAWDLGLRAPALAPKRALQFGSRIANPKEQGHLPSQRLKNI